MSLVGTRPILPDELEQYELHHRARIAIKPGITGMWQVSGRSDITDFEEIVRLDTEYISEWNMLSDTAISSRVDEPSVLYNSMGEGQTTRFGYYVEEGLLKLIKIADDFAVSFATADVKKALEMIETLKI